MAAFGGTVIALSKLFDFPAQMFSGLAFELGVMNKLFKARSTIKPSNSPMNRSEQYNGKEYREVHLDFW